MTNKSTFTDGKPLIATKEDCSASWGGAKNGAEFRTKSWYETCSHVSRNIMGHFWYHNRTPIWNRIWVCIRNPVWVRINR